MVISGISRGMPDNLHQRLWPFIPTRGFLETAWESCPCGGTYRVFRSTLQGLNQLIVGPSPLYEITYSTSHEITNDGSLWILCLINCIVQRCLYWLANVVKIKPTRTCAKILKVRTYSLLLFSKSNPGAKKPFMSRIGEVVITDG
jgi:hypothetical protein